MSQTQASWATTLILLSLIQYASSNSIGFSLKLIPITSPESPLFIGNLSESEKIHQLVQMSQDNTRLPVSRLYQVETQIGNPSIPVFLVMDTGSSLTWTQCQPCEHCYYQSSPIYNSSASLTYRPPDCDDPLCQHHGPFRCENQICVYTISYADGTSTGGIAARERFGFLGDKIRMVFGCSNYRDGPAFSDDRLSGILGLGPGQESLIQQNLGDEIGKRFSYCLVPFNEGARASYLRFGQDIVTPGRHFESTPLLATQALQHYCLFLTDISVNGKRLGFRPGTFMLQPSGKGGCIIDSGTYYTSIEENAFRIVIGAFEVHFSRFKLRRYNGHPNFELCYHKSRPFSSYPSMTYHFQGANFFVEPKYVTNAFKFDGAEIFCVMLRRNRFQKTVIGAWHQVNNRFIYDLNTGTLQFAPEDCERDHLQFD